MKISIISFLFVAISSTTLVGAQNAATKSNLRRRLNDAQRSLQEYTYEKSTFCQLQFCEDFYTSCAVTNNPLDESAPYTITSGADYCRVTLLSYVEITCTQECDVTLDMEDEPEDRTGGDDSLPTGQFQIKRNDISDDVCLELEGMDDWSNVFQTDCDDNNQAQQWVLVEKVNGQNMPVFTLSPAQNTGLCLDMDRSMHDLQLYDCKDSSAYTANQEFDTQFFNDSGGKLFIDERCVYVGTYASVDNRILGDKDKDKVQCASSSDIPQFIFE